MAPYPLSTTDIGIHAIRWISGYPTTLETLPIVPFIGVLSLIRRLILSCKYTTTIMETYLPGPENPALRSLPNLKLYFEIPDEEEA
jgi:hypothetical protein